MASSDIILASASPRRLDLLAQIGIKPAHILVSDIDETPQRKETGNKLAIRLATEKARFIHDHFPEHHNNAILAADTVVVCGQRILPKAETVEQARYCLRLLSGRRHRVYGGIALIVNGKTHNRLVQTIVQFKRLSDQEIDTYLACGEWQGKAGGYAIQGRAAAYIKQIRGSYSNIVGLCLHQTYTLLDGNGLIR